MSKQNNDIREIALQIKKYQKKLVPLNLFVMLLALVAAASLMFMPLISIDAAEFAEAYEIMAAEQSDEEGGSEFTDMISTVSKNLELKFSVTTFQIAKLAFVEDPVAVITETVADSLTEMTDALIVNVAIPAAIEAISEETELISENLDVQVLADKFSSLEAASADEVDGVIEDFTAELQKQLGTDVMDDVLKADLNEYIRDFYDECTEYTEDGSFTVESGICVMLSKTLFESEDEVYTSYNEIVSEFVDKSGINSPTEDEGFAKYVGTVVDSIRYFTYTMFFFIGVWVLLFLFAFFHLLAKNKRFMMWYVKLFGCYPCIVFFLFPFLAKHVLGDVIGTGLAALIGTISSFTWISGICYLLLWLVSICWAFPIKHNIRALAKDLKRAL